MMGFLIDMDALIRDILNNGMSQEKKQSVLSEVLVRAYMFGGVETVDEIAERSLVPGSDDFALYQEELDSELRLSNDRLYRKLDGTGIAAI